MGDPHDRRERQGEPAEDWYAVLGVPRHASRDAIRAAYRRQARLTHPDSGGRNDPAKLARLTQAWRVLSDDTTRAAYDQARDRRLADASDWDEHGDIPGTDDEDAERDGVLDAWPTAGWTNRRPVARLAFIIPLGLALFVLTAVALFIYGFLQSPTIEP